ncbi:MAG: hypothetical protein V4678_02385 [Patescibacteria group bacterium]
MSKNQIDTQTRWSRKAPLRLAGYLAPLVVFILAVLWLNPQNTIGWVAASFPSMVAFVLIFLPTFTQARNEIERRAYRRMSHAEPSFMKWSTERFNDPMGEVPMDDFLARQP